MTKLKKIFAAVAIACAFGVWAATPGANVIEEVAWMVGDEPIYRSEIEDLYQEIQSDRTPIDGDPYCIIPEQIAIERLFLHQADIDTLEASESMVQLQLDQQLNYLINNLGSREKVEQYFRKSWTDIREQYARSIRNRSRIMQVRNKLTEDIKVTPGDVRRYVDGLPTDSIPFMPLQVEVQILTLNPQIPRQEIDDVKARLRDYADRVNRGETEFSILATLYSDDESTARRGGETGFQGRNTFVPEFSAVAFNLNDPKKVSKIVETEFGYHIIQLIEKRGDRINVRHILLRPRVADKDLADAITRLDSVRTDIVDRDKLKFEDAVRYLSQDRDTRYSNGVMVNEETGTTRFQMSELPQEVAKAVAGLEPGQLSQPFIMRDPKRDREIVAMVKLSNRIPAHKATLAEDFQIFKNMYEAAQKQEIIDKWLEKKIQDTYVRIEDGWRGCEFKHNGWNK